MIYIKRIITAMQKFIKNYGRIRYLQNDKRSNFYFYKLCINLYCEINTDYYYNSSNLIIDTLKFLDTWEYYDELI